VARLESGFGFAVCCACLFAPPLAGQGLITTIAGRDWFYPSLTTAPLDSPITAASGLAFDNRGNLYLADPNNLYVFQLPPSGPLSVFAGNGLFFAGGDGGPARAAGFNAPAGVAVGPDGRVYITDRSNHRIRCVSPGGVISTIAGNPALGRPDIGFAGDGGPALRALLNGPTGIGVDASGIVYFVDQGNHRIRRVTPDGIITTIAGNGTPGDSGDGGSALRAQFNFGSGIGPNLAVDARGNVYVADLNNHRVRRISIDGIVTTVAGTGRRGFSGDGGPATAAQLAQPFGVALDRAGRLLITDFGNSRIRVVGADGAIETFAGNGRLDYSGDGGPALAAAIGNPRAISVDGAGNVVFSDFFSDRIRRIRPDGVITTIAGNGRFRFSGDGGPGPLAHLFAPHGIALARDGTVFVSDTANYRVRAIAPGGASIRTVAGDGRPRFGGDNGPAAQASLYRPEGLALDERGNLFVCDSINGRVRLITPQGIITTVAGGGTEAGDGGLATQAVLVLPRGVAVDPSGNIYVSEAGAHRIRRVLTNGVIETVAGTGAPGFGGDGGNARLALLNAPAGLALDRSGALYFADRNNHRVRRIATNGVITTVAGTGQVGSAGDGGPAAAAQLNFPWGVAVDPGGQVYISDMRNNRVRRINADGTMALIAGLRTDPASCCDGALATQALFFDIAGVAVDSAGSVYVLDTGNARVRQILASPPAFGVDRTSLVFTASAGGAPAPVQRVTVRGSLDGIRFAVAARTHSGGNWLSARLERGETPEFVDVAADPASLAPGSYRGTVTVIADSGQAPPIEITVELRVTEGLAPRIDPDRDQLTFVYPRGASAQAQSLTLRNGGAGVLGFNVTARTLTGGAWLRVSPAAGQASPRTPAAVRVDAEAGALGPGTYSGLVLVTASNGETKTIPVTMLVSGRDRAVLLTQSGLSFTAVSGGGIVPPQTFGVLNPGSVAMPFSVSTSTIEGGPWLSATPASGVAAGPASGVEVSVNQHGLDAGRYYGIVRVDAPGAPNSPQVVTVFFEVLPPGSNPGQVAQPSELVFRMAAGADMPPAQEVLGFNLLASPLGVRTNLVPEVFGQAVGFVNRPRFAQALPNHPARIVVQPFPTAIPDPGIYRGTMTLSFDDGTVRKIGLSIVVGAVVGSKAAGAGSDGCAPQRLIPTPVAVAQGFSVAAGWPAPITVDLQDDCGEPVTSGSVSAVFSTGEPPVPLVSLRDGRWQGTWETRASSRGPVTITLRAEDPERRLAGESQVTAALRASQDPPAFGIESVVSAASPRPFTPVAPGALISLGGERFSRTAETAAGSPLPVRLGETSVMMTDRPVPLLFAGPDRIGAVVPFGLEPNTVHQIRVRRGSTISRPVAVNVASTQPAVFPAGAGAGTQALATIVRGEERFLNSAAAPARAGDLAVVLCAGMGEVDAPLEAGAAATPGVSLRTREPVLVRVGGVEAKVEFAGMAPGLVGVYQVSFTIPEGVETGPAVDLTIEAGGQTSPPSTLAIADQVQTSRP